MFSLEGFRFAALLAALAVLDRGVMLVGIAFVGFFTATVARR